MAKATFYDRIRSFTVYNSLPGNYGNLIETWLPAVLDCIVKANMIADNYLITLWGNSQWSLMTLKSLKVTLSLSLQQADDYSCGVYTIFNTLALVQQQKPLLQPINPRALRLKYAKVLVKAV